MPRPTEPGTQTGATRALLGRLIDHAPLFPPASMTMNEALDADRRVRAGEAGWIVNRFVCPASRLVELGGRPLELSVVVDVDARLLPLADARVEALEFPPGRDPIDAGAREVYVEVPPGDDVSVRIGWLADLGLRAKVRCGGRTVPSVRELAEFVRRCRESRVPMKATAGLHQPVRRGEEHGFLNLLAAAVFGEEESALADDEPSAFALTERAFRWRERFADATEIARIRRELFVAFGSCSADEPADGLRALGML